VIFWVAPGYPDVRHFPTDMVAMLAAGDADPRCNPQASVKAA
jgi:hypothetical protein